MDPASTTSSEALQLLRTGQVSSQELLDVHLAKIEQHNVRRNLVVAHGIARVRHALQPTPLGLGGASSVRCTVFRSPSRTPPRPRGS
jgi:hypothetical protein